MNILELDSFNLDDAVKFHDRLNHRLWDRSEHLHPKVHVKLMEIARDFQDFLGVPDLNVKDITISGSNAAYNYTKNSDIDLHLVVDVPEVEHDEVYRELFNAKKYQYNDQHNIKIGGADVELYAQDSKEQHHSQGIYSLLRNAWVSVPKRKKAEIDDVSTRSKYQDLTARIDDTIKTNDAHRMANLMNKIKVMRQTGLEQQGEFGADNLAFKMLRNNGYIKRLVDARNAARDLELSLAELAQPRQRVQYGFMSESPDGVDPTTKMFLEEPVDESPDGVNPTTAMFLTETNPETIVDQFIKHTVQRLGIKNIPEIFIHHDEEWSKDNHSFGMYVPEKHELHVSLGNRHVLDVLRTTAHELCHCAQHEQESLPHNAGVTGSPWENEAHAVAGIVMRDFADEHPEYFKMAPIKENASGYIPKNKKEARDPRYSMAVSVDVGPGQVGKEANKLALNTGRNGEPGLLMKSANLREGKIKLSTDPKNYGATIDNYKATGPVVDMRLGQLVGFEPDDKMNQPASKANVKKIIAGLKRGDELPPLLVRKYKNGYQILDGHHRFHAYKLTGAKSIPVQIVPAKDIEEIKESRMPQPSQGQGRYRDLNAPLGPEFKPTMPKGTVRVDVSDVYDWYKLGKHIPNLDRADPGEFGKGPPSTIVSFGDEDTEHKYIKGLEKLGLTTTDIDPVDPNQPKGMKRQKVDPTYNVAEAANAGPQIVYATGPRTQGVNDVDLVFKDLRTNRIVAHVVGNNSSLAEFAPPSGGGGGGGLPDRGATYEIRMGNAAKPSYVAFGDPQRDSEHRVYKLGPARPGAPEYYGHGLTLVSELDWWSFLEKMLGEIMWEDDAIEAGYVDRLDNGDLVFTKQQDMEEQNNLAESLRQELKLFEEQDLFEITMSPSNLKKEAARTGALAGMEFEMIVPNVQGDPSDFESEPDYDRDERCRSIEDAVQFFYDGDFNGRRDIERLREKMNEDYLEWLDGKIEEEWDNDGEEYIQEWVSNNVDEDEWNPDGLEGSDRQGALEEFATNVHADPMSDYYQQARDEFREERQDGWDESDWLDAEDLDRMSDIENAYNINWPYYTEPGDEYGQAEISDVAQDFQDSIGRDTYAADSYHSSGTLRPSPSRIRYVVEPDGSLEGDNPGDRGLEFVSPPLPIDEILSDLNKVKAWAKAYGCYTNDSTGLHINISVPDYDRTKLDFVKLALLMGDKYVLDLFGRSGNTYARSAFDIVKRAVRDNPEEAAKLLDKMKGNLDSLATKAIHSGVTQKYTSINTKDGHIEFRSPGGDWLDQNFDQIENTLLRFTVAMSAALNPEMYREEYLKKLYKLLSENNRGDDTIRYFSDYVAGKIPRAALRSFVKQAQLERRLKRDPTEGERYWWRVDKEGRGRDGASIELVATSKKEALEKAREEWRIPAGDAAMRRAEAYPLRPYTDTKQADTGSGPTLNGRPSNPDGRYVIVPEQDRQTVYYRFQAAGPDDAAIVLRQWRQEHPGRIWLTLRDDNGVLGQPEGTGTPRFGLWDFGEGGFINSRGAVGQGGRLLGGDSFDAARAAARNSGLASRIDMGEVEIRRIPQEQPQNWRDQLRQHLQGNWGIYITTLNRFARMPNTDAADNVLRRFPSRESAEQYLATTRGENPRMRTDVEVREIEPESGFQFELSQSDIENRLGWGGQAADANYEVVNRATMRPVFKFIANTPEEANTKYAQILQAMGMPPETEDYGYRDIVVPGSTIDLQRRRAAAASDNVFGITGQPSDRTDGRNTNYSFRDLFGTNATADQQQGGIVDVAPDVAQNFPSVGREFAGWRVLLPSGEEVYQFSGVGNSQADANRIAAEWLRNNGYGVSGEGYEVVPVWREA